MPRPYGEHDADGRHQDPEGSHLASQIADSVDLIVQVKRLRDGSRRVTNITEVIGMEGDVIVTQELFKFEYLDEDNDGKIIGEYPLDGPAALYAGKGRQFGFDQAYAGSLPIGLHISRATLGTIGMVLNFGGYILLPLAEATTIGFTMPIFATLLSVFFPRRAPRHPSLGGGYCGVSRGTRHRWAGTPRRFSRFWR
jgi:hypothetical protein